MTAFMTTDLSDAHAEAAPFGPRLSRFWRSSARFHGQAKTLVTFEDNNTKVRNAVEISPGAKWLGGYSHSWWSMALRWPMTSATLVVLVAISPSWRQKMPVDTYFGRCHHPIFGCVRDRARGLDKK